MEKFQSLVLQINDLEPQEKPNVSENIHKFSDSNLCHKERDVVLYMWNL